MAFCGSPTSPSPTTANLFDTQLCNNTFDIVRGRACLAGYTGEGSNSCGDEDTGGTYVQAYCASDDSGVATNIKDCPNGYTRLNATAVTNCDCAYYWIG